MNVRTPIEVKRSALCGAVLATTFMLAPCVSGQGDVQKLVPPPDTPGSQCGRSVSVHGSTAIAGAPLDDEGGTNAGAVYVSRYDVASETWGAMEKLLPPPGSDGDRFGWSVSVYGDVALIGADRDDDSGTNAGAAYLYRYDEGAQTWGMEQKLVPPAPADADQFGWTVALGGDAAVIGAPSDDDGGSNAGAAYFYRYDAGTQTWGAAQKVVPGAAFDAVGTSVAIDGDAAMVGAPGDAEIGIDAGAAYFYRYDPQTQSWGSAQKGLPPGPDPEDGQAGSAVTISGDWAALGAKGADASGGAVFFFTYNDESQSWGYRTGRLNPDPSPGGDSFGASIAMSGTVIMIGSPGDDDSGSNAGAAYEYRYDAGIGAWMESSKLVPPSPSGNDGFGAALALHGPTAVVGASGDDDSGNDAGAAYAAPILPSLPVPDTAWVVVAGGVADDLGVAIGVDAAGNSYVTGIFQGEMRFDRPDPTVTLFSAGGYDVFFVKHDPGGELLWAVRAGGLSDDTGVAVAVMADGTSFLTGEYQGSATFGSGPSAVTLTSVGERDIFVAKYDPAGGLAWAVTAGGTGNDVGLGVAVDDAGYAYVTGAFNQSADFGTPSSPHVIFSAGSNDVFLAKYDPSGTLQWVVGAGGAGLDIGYGTAVDGAGDAYVTGRYDGTATFGSGGAAVTLTSAGMSDIFVAKYGTTGDLAWVVSAGGPNPDISESIAVDAAGNASVVGEYQETTTFGEGTSTVTLAGDSADNAFVARYDAGGALGVGNPRGASGILAKGVVVDDHGNSYVTGAILGLASFETVGGETFGMMSLLGYDIFAAKYDSEGDLAWIYKPAGFGSDLGRGIAVDGTGACHLTGEYSGNTSFDILGWTALGERDTFIWKSAPPEIACPTDLDGDGMIGFADLLQVLSSWGPCGVPCPADLDSDGFVGFSDLLIVLSEWGACE